VNERFLKACRREAVDRSPIWVMRQAGRYLPEYRELRKKCTMMEAVTTPEIAAEVTLLPLRRFPFDAAILFSDLTVPFTPMGAAFDLKEGVGPVVHHPVRSASDLAGLRRLEPSEDLPYVLETIKILKGELKVPLIGFTGAPFTLASYMIEGGPSKDLKLTRRMMYSEPALWHSLMELLADSVAAYLAAQMEAGADAVQLFDSWVGVLSEAAYREFLLPHMRVIFAKLSHYGKPVIHFGTGNPTLLPVLAEAGGTVLGVDWRISLTDAFASVGRRDLAYQGNLDPALLLAGGTAMESAAKDILEEGRRLPGHIFNLGHGIFPDTPLANMEALMNIVCEAPVVA
jgi:uroporphyrinogen decarboxylase